MLKPYLKKVFEIYSRGDAREESFYPALGGLLELCAEETGKKDVRVTSLPKKTEGGNPDFRVWDGRSRITGYIEAKHPSFEDLASFEDTEQIRRYLDTFPNLILTNFHEFRLYRNGGLVKTARITRPIVARRLKTLPPVENEADFLDLLEKFFSFSLPRSFSAKTLAVELARRTRFLKDEVTLNELKREKAEGRGEMLGFYEAFHKYLIHGLTEEEFADLYSQTIAYGLFAARTRASGEFTRKSAFELIPHTIGILREVFRYVSLGELPAQMEWIVDDIAEVLSNADVNKILHDYFHEGKGRDPVVHFYETFLAEYDPKTRERRGVYYTPEPVVSYIVRSLDVVLREKFDREDGLATGSVTVLDPAGGTLTFPAEAARLAVESFTARYGEGAREGLIRDHILNNFYSFELMMAPYAVGHIKMGFLLEELGYRLKKEDRFKLYLTNTLEMEEFEETRLPFMRVLSEESHLAGRVKKDTPILVIMGNPPYSGHSFNVGEWITGLIEDYKEVDGKPLGEKNPKWLQDDYVKFLRFAQWKIDRAGMGCVGMITNHSWLDNPTFRGMRQSLMNSFDEIYVLNLHGNSLKKERCPDGSEDRNVFDIRQGVAISLFVKSGDEKKKTRIHYADLWGQREKKYGWLEKHDIKKTEWKRLTPKSEFYFFVPREEKFLEKYEKLWKVTDIFPLNGVGMTTARDGFVIDVDKKALLNRIRLFKNSKLPDEELHQFFEIKRKKGWNIRKAWKMLQEIPDEELKKFILPVLYRPFDVQWIFYHDAVVWRTVKVVMRHMMGENIGLCIGRAGQVVGIDKPWNIVFCSEHIEDFNLFYRGGNVNMPLYLYEEKAPPKNSSGTLSLFEGEGGEVTKKPNLSPGLLKELTGAFKKTPTPEDIFCYIYAVCHSNIYRSKYAEFLKTDFPRIPFTADHKLFKKLAGYGRELVDLHLLKSKGLSRPVVKFQGRGENLVEKPRYDGAGKRVYINEGRYFEGMEKEVWEHHIGGYRVMEKWLKDRKGRILSTDDVKHYCRVATAIKTTMEIQKKIDRDYPGIEEKLVG